LSVGVVARQDVFFSKKKASGLDPQAFYKDYLKLVPQINDMLSNAEIVGDIKQASDWSYSASAYAGPHFRIIGDAGCFVDPYFSSGMHLAMVSGLAAATSIQAARKEQCSELDAAIWHTTKVAEGYTRFLLLVMSVQKQLRMKDSPILTSDEEDGFDTAFRKIQAVIQGVADTETEDALVQRNASQSVDYALDAMEIITPEKQRAIIEKIDSSEETLTTDEIKILSNIVARTFETKHTQSLEQFTGDIINGLSAKLVRGDLGLIRRSVNGSTEGPDTVAA
jgi:flavin-dependent dehydrogenase